jgi:hypothetical protein
VSGRPKKARWTDVLSQQAVRASRKDRRGRVGVPVQVVAGIGLIVASALFAGWVHVQALTVEYRVAEMVRLQGDLRQERAGLEIERQMLRTPKRLSELAEREFGMILPEVENRVVLR